MNLIDMTGYFTTGYFSAKKARGLKKTTKKQELSVRKCCTTAYVTDETLLATETCVMLII